MSLKATKKVNFQIAITGNFDTDVFWNFLERPAISLLHEVNNYMLVFNDKDERQLWMQDIEPKQNPQLVVPSRESVEVPAFKLNQSNDPTSPRAHLPSPRELSPSNSPTAVDNDKKK